MFKQVGAELHASLLRVLEKVAMLLPAIFALALALIISALIGLLLSYMIRRILGAMRFDERMRAGTTSDLLEWSSIRSLTLLLSQIAFWACMIVGAVIGISAFAAAYNDNGHLAALMIPYVGHSVGAALIFLIGTLAARFLARTVLIGAVNLKLHYARLLSQGVKWMIMVLTIAMMLDHLNIGGLIVDLAFGILFGGIVLTLALSIGFSKPDFILQSLDQDERGAKPEPEKGSGVRHF
ncbi:MAG: hypothetical protein P4L10_11250 [Acidobacteriaceae bacterium]|jgi:hypothetical protein|nr:hypothetical protein [Acidobacteriaceae bacterium]